MKLKIAIHNVKGSFSDRWILYCKNNKIEYKLINSYDSDILNQLYDCSHFLWHFHHNKLKDKLFAKQLLYSIENLGIKVFPNFNTAWHFDDKIGQKYLLESIGAPLVKSYIFYDKISALEWVRTTNYPVVFKLRGGAGSANVKLIKTKSQAIGIITKAFSKGFDGIPRLNRMKENWLKFKKYKTFIYFRETLAGMKNYIFPTNKQKLENIVEKGYLYVQDFLPNNNHDIRIIVIGDRAFGLKRMVRENDFRASGSNMILYGKNDIDKRCVKIAFDTNKKLKSQSIAYDFVFDQNNEPKIVEISYAYAIEAYDSCEGYWDINLKWFPGNFNPQYWMIRNLIEEASKE